MKNRLRILALVLACAVSAGAAQDNAAAAGADRPDQKTTAPALNGAKLLDLFIINLNEMAKSGSTSDLDKRLKEMKAGASQAREANLIDAHFLVRYNRLLAMTKLIATPDSSGVLGPVIDDVVTRFVYDILGQDFKMGKGPEAIRMVADSLAEEIIDLQIYLDTLGKRDALRKKIDSMSSPSK